MGLTERLAILIDANGAGAVREFERVGKSAEKDLGKAETSAASMSAGLVKSGAIMVGVGAVFEVGFLKAAKAAGVHETALAKLENTLDNNAKLAGQSTAAYEAQAEALAKTTSAGRDEVLTVQALVGQYKLNGDQIQTLTPLIVDLAGKMNGDFAGAAKAVGKAMEGSAGGLKRQGVIVDENVFKVDRYRAVQEALNVTVGGFAEKEGKTFEGQLAIIGNQLTETEQGVGVGAANAFSHFLGVVNSVNDGLKNISPDLQAGVGEWGTYAATGLIAAGVVSTLAGFVVKAAANISALSGILGTSTAATTADAAAKGTDAAATAALSEAEQVRLAATSGATTAAVADTAATTAEAASMTVAGGAVAVLAGALIGLAAGFHIVSEASDESKKMFKDVDFTNFDDATVKLTATGQEINGLKDKWDGYNVAEKLAHYQEGVNLDKLTDQQNENLKHIEAQRAAYQSVGKQLGITGNDAKEMLEKLKIDPTQVGWDKLGPELQAYQSGAKTAEQVTGDLKHAMADGADQAVSLDDQLKKLKTAEFGLVDAQHAYADSGQRVVDAQDGVSMSAEHVADAQQAVQDAANRVVEAEQAEADAWVKVRDAKEKVIDASNKLNEVNSGGAHGNDYELGKREANLRLKEATEKVTDAEKKAREARTPADKAKAAEALEQARIDLLRDQNGVLDANAAQSKDAASATDSLHQAQDGVTQAVKAAQSAHDAVAKAVRDEQRAEENVTKAKRDSEKAQRDLTRAEYDSVKSLDALITKSDEFKTSMAENADSTQALISKLLDMEKLNPALTSQIEPLLSDAGYHRVGANKGHHEAELSGHYYGGMPGAVSRVNELGTELFHQGGRDYLLSRGAGGSITPAGQFNVMGGDGGGQPFDVHTHLIVDGREQSVTVTRHQVPASRGARR